MPPGSPPPSAGTAPVPEPPADPPAPAAPSAAAGAAAPAAAPAAWRVTSGGYAPQTVERLLRALPRWFGIEASNAAYVETARRLPAYLAWPAAVPAGPDGDPGAAGVLLLERHFPGAAEICLLAVDPAYHRRGAGRALIAAAQARLITDGVEFLQVETLGPSHPDEGYQRTRKFYAAVGFAPLEEIHGVWDPGNPCLIMIKHLAPGDGPRLPRPG